MDDSNGRIATDVRWAPVPEWVLFHPDLSAQAVRVYGLLQRRANDDGRAWPSYAHMARKCHCSPSTVKRAVSELLDVGAVTKVSQGSAASQTANEYVVWTSPPEMRSASATARVHGGAGPPVDEPPGAGPPVDEAGPQVDEGSSASDPPMRASEREPVNENTPSDLRPDQEWATNDTDIDTVKATARAVATMIAANGHPLPNRGTKAHRTWLIEMDRLLRLGPAGQTTVDPPTPDQVIAVARWATSDSFWASNIQSIPKLRDKWSQLALKARRTNGSGQPTGLDAVAAYANRMADR